MRQEQRLVLSFIRDFERIIISDLPGVSPCIQEGRFTMVNRISATLRRVPVIRFRYEGPDQRGFSFCSVAIKSRKQFAARNSHKGRTVALLSEQFYLTTEFSNVVGTNFSSRDPAGTLAVGGNAFSSGKLTAHRHGTLFCTKIPFWFRVTAALEYRLSVDSQTIQRSVSALSAACFCSQQNRFLLLYIAFDPLLGSPSEWLYCDRFFDHIVFAMTVGILALVKTPGNHLLITSIMDYPSNFLC